MIVTSASADGHTKTVLAFVGQQGRVCGRGSVPDSRREDRCPSSDELGLLGSMNFDFRGVSTFASSRAADQSQIRTQGRMMNQQDAFLESIVADPQDDSVRLIFADWLEENSGNHNTCPVCLGSGFSPISDPKWGNDTCPNCTGDGKMHNGFANRAGFIRTQIALSKLTPYPQLKHIEEKAKQLETRSALEELEKQLLRDCGVMWIPEYGRFARFEKESEPFKIVAALSDQMPHLVLDTEYLFTRGFVSKVSTTCEVWLKHGKEIAAKCPLEEVKLTDRHPRTPRYDDAFNDQVSFHRGLKGMRTFGDQTLPSELFDLLEPTEKRHWQGSFTNAEHQAAYYLTVDAARADLSRACIKWAKTKEESHETSTLSAL